MKISQSAVAMKSSSSYSHYQESKVTSILVRPGELEAAKKARQERLKEEADEGVDVSISDESQSLLEDLMAEKKKAAKGQQNKEKEQEAIRLEDLEPVNNPVIRFSDKEEQTLKTLKRILEMLNRMRKNGNSIMGRREVNQMMSMSEEISESSSASVSLGNGSVSFGQSSSVSISQSLSLGASSVIDLRSVPSVRNGVGTSWIRHTETNSFVMEQESTTFSAKGIAKTADGREIEFGVDMSMSRGFAGNIFSSKDESVILTDPLVINLESNSASVTDQKFFFDLDSDGKEEQISQLGAGSGFLAYDKNGDGIVNDGSELFGTKSGDGFTDLADYDEDGNGWIDENDDIFQKLKVWTKDAEGNDKLLDLKEANVGAIYLGSADTQMHLNDAYTNQTNAVIRKTGVFLRESGEVGTIQHVDLAV